jgi:hypothetical protein
MIITTKYDIGQAVTILEIGLIARIVEIRQDGKNLWYKTQYWMEGKVFFIDLDEGEIEGLPLNKQKCGI